jgi:hypothetical protein
MTTITALENRALLALVDLMYAERGFSDVDAEDLADRSDLPINILRGVMGSLSKKQLIDVDEEMGNIIYLTEYTEGMVDDWLIEGAPTPVEFEVIV